MKKLSFFFLSLGLLAFVGCKQDQNPDVPVIPHEPVTSYGDEGFLLYGSDEEITTCTYSWEAEDNTIVINIEINSDEVVEVGDWEMGHFTLPASQINEFLGMFVSELDESTFVALEPNGNDVEEMTSYKPGMWVDADGYSCGWSDGALYWQWYIWGGKTDKNGDEIGYDYDYTEYPSMFIVGTNPGNTSSAFGKTITSKSIITKGEETYFFVVNVKFSESEGGDPGEEGEGFQDEPMLAGMGGHYYSSGVFDEHQFAWYFTDTTLNVDVDVYIPSIVEAEAWEFLDIVINPDVMLEELGIADINALADITYFYPLAPDGTPYTNWSSYAPGEWVNEDGTEGTWQNAMYWQYQFGDNKYDGHTTEGLLVIGVNPSNVEGLAGKTVKAQAQLGSKKLVINATFHADYPTEVAHNMGPHSYSWKLSETGMDINVFCSLSNIDDSWNWFGFALNELYINDYMGIEIDSLDITDFYPTAADGTPYTNWSSYAPGEWFAADGSEAAYDTGWSFWQYYTHTEHDYAIPNLVLLGNNCNAEIFTVGQEVTSKAILAGMQWNVKFTIVE